MILIADSGSSNTNWCLIEEDKELQQVQTIGFNPFYQSEQQLDKEVKDTLLPQINNSVSHIFYYGTGCSTDANKKIVKDVLAKYFEAAEIDVWHDLLASARALCGNSAGVACIMGTGINSCFYDGENITENVTSLGYVLGDEGSGAYLGKTLVADLLRMDVPEHIKEMFEARYELDRDTILEKVYQEEAPSRFLATFTRFIHDNIKESYCHDLVYRSFVAFFEKNILKYKACSTHPVHFTGSIAYYFSDILNEVASEKGITIGKIVKSPLIDLTLYHKKTV